MTLNGKDNSIVSQAERVARAYQGISQENGEGVTIPGGLFWFVLGFAGGMLLREAVIEAGRGGAARLGELARRRFE